MNAKQYEQAFLAVSAIVLVVFLGALGISAWGMGVSVPTEAGEVVPARIDETPPFDDPGVKKQGPKRYTVVMMAQAFLFRPRTIRVPAGSTVTFIATSRDVLHGLKVRNTAVNAMLIPGQITRVTHTFEEPREHTFYCHEYCGAGHHAMFGKLIVEPREGTSEEGAS